MYSTCRIVVNLNSKAAVRQLTIEHPGTIRHSSPDNVIPVLDIVAGIDVPFLQFRVRE